MINLPQLGLGAILVAAWSVAAPHAHAAPTQVTIPSTAMPWNYGSKLNAHRVYGVDDGTSPVVLTLAELSASPGQKLAVKYISGCIGAGGGYPCGDAAGDAGYVTDHNTGSSGKYFPSFYIKQEPTYLVELVGVFTDANGKIVGQPFAIGDKRSKVIPDGATQLQLGVNDDILSDNTGNWLISVEVK